MMQLFSRAILSLVETYKKEIIQSILNIEQVYLFTTVRE